MVRYHGVSLSSSRSTTYISNFIETLIKSSDCEEKPFVKVVSSPHTRNKRLTMKKGENLHILDTHFLLERNIMSYIFWKQENYEGARDWD